MIRLRRLRKTDARYMLEWMHDFETQRSFQKNMIGVTLEEAEIFCEEAGKEALKKMPQYLHLAVTDDSNEYLGTISLKHINYDYNSAEYAIALRKKARGRGVAFDGTKLLLREGFNTINLHRIYLTVLDDNLSAIKLYEKSGFKLEGILRDHIKRENEYVSWKIYGILENEFKRMEGNQ